MHCMNQEVHYRIHNRSPLAHILSQENSFYNILSCFLKMQFNIAFSYEPIFSKWFPFFKSCLPKCLLPISPMRVACFASFIVLVISDENYELQCCASRSFVAFLSFFKSKHSLQNPLLGQTHSIFFL